MDMARAARKIAVGFPHHVIQRGVQRGAVFHKENDYQFYLDLMREWLPKSAVDIWAYCLMPNHVHFVAIPYSEDGLSKLFSQVHKRYAMMVNKRAGSSGHLWQGRFSSFVMDESYTLQATRYIERNPVTAGMVAKAGDYRWSSARFHLDLTTDSLVSISHPLRHLVQNWESYLADETPPSLVRDFEKHATSGKPLGSDAFLTRIR